MSLLDTASLIVTPNGYKEGKLYSVIPSDGSGDMSVTRATTATRVNSAGLVELVPYNLLQYSEDFSNAAWISGEVSLLSGQSSPNGTNTAFKISGTSAANAFLLQVGIPVTSGNTYTASVYLKGDTSGSVSLRVDSGSTAPNNPVSYTTEWQRFTYTFTAGSTTATAILGGYNTWTGSEAIYVYGFQLVEGSVAKDYQKTETRLNIPRLDYSNGTCPSLLVEPQRTNILPYSSSFDNAAWGKDNNGSGTLPIVTANYATSPDGTMSADRAQFTNIGGSGNSSNYSLIGQYPLSLGSTGTATIWLKSNTSLNQNVLCYWGGGQGDVFEVTPTWQRFTLSNLSASGLSNLAFGTRGGSGSFFNGGDEVLDILVWGAQLEVGNYSTSYIPTTSASVTRNADVISKTGISSLIGQTEGVIFYDFILSTTGVDFTLANLYSSSNANSYSLFYINPSNQIGVSVINNGSTECEIIVPTLALGRHRIAFAYKQNDFVVYVDGVQIGTDTNGTIPTMDNFNLIGFNLAPSAYRQEVNIYAAALWKTRLTNTQLAQLTSI